MIADIHPHVLVFLCPDCAHGRRCPGYASGISESGSVTCRSYRPERNRKNELTPAQVLALPDREPCADCACRKGSQPHGTAHTMARFAACVERLEPFLCHNDGQRRVCGGWIRAAKARATPTADVS